MKSAGFPHKKFLFGKSNTSSSGLRKNFLDPGTPLNMFPDTCLRCRLSPETNCVIIRHIDTSISHKTSANTHFPDPVLAQNWNLRSWISSKHPKRCDFYKIVDFQSAIKNFLEVEWTFHGYLGGCKWIALSKNIHTMSIRCVV